jgi:hypothetical protein
VSARRTVDPFQNPLPKDGLKKFCTGGNRAPFGIIREGKPSTLRVDEAKAATVRRAYELAAVGQTD